MAESQPRVAVTRGGTPRDVYVANRLCRSLDVVAVVQEVSSRIIRTTLASLAKPGVAAHRIGRGLRSRKRYTGDREACFDIVRMNSTASASVLAGPRVVVTGKVDDVRPWERPVRVGEAPLQVVRGVQNKVFGAMPIGRQARRRVVNCHDWDARLALFGELLEAVPDGQLAKVG